MHTIHLVQEFHGVFGHPIEPDPTVPTAETRLLRFRLIFEELMEFGRAIGLNDLQDMDQEEFDENIKSAMEQFTISPDAKVDLTEAADALGDLDYVVQGSNLVFGFPAEDVVREIHRANMSKLGEDGRPIRDAFGKIIKGPNYRKPNVARLLLSPGLPEEE